MMPATSLYTFGCHYLETRRKHTKVACAHGAWTKSSSQHQSLLKPTSQKILMFPGSSPLGRHPSLHPHLEQGQQL